MSHASRDTKNAAKPCIWMQAGVVGKKDCPRDYQCLICPYDRALRRAANTGRLPHWKDRMRELPSDKRPCVHSMKGDMEFRTCAEDYNCASCGFDHYFEALYRVSATINPVDFLNVKGFSLPHGFYLYPGHTWIKLEEDATVRIGLDDFILRVLGPLDRIEAPLVGHTLSRDTPQIALQRGDSVAWALSPISGVVTDINPMVRESGLDSSVGAYTWGWIARIRCDSLRRELGSAMLGGEATQFVETEAEALFSRIEDCQGPLAADGGELAQDLCGNLPDLDWGELARTFLRS